MYTAEFVRHVALQPAAADQRVYRLSPPLAGYAHVIVSAMTEPDSGPEACIFGADERGRVTDWSPLPGTYRGGLAHAEALAGAGYTLVTARPRRGRLPRLAVYVQTLCRYTEGAFLFG